MLIARQPLLKLLGASADIYAYAQGYLVIMLSGIPLMMFSQAISRVLRADGQVKGPMYGNILSSITNIVLDPLFILVLGWGVKGAAFATVLANGVNCIYLLWLIRKRPDYHSGPDVKPRKLNDLELMEQGVKLGARAVVTKTHFAPTADRATLVNQIRREKYPDSDFELIGSLVLNRSVGGMNPHAVETALKLGAKVIWLPTLDAENQLIKDGKFGGIPLVRDGKAVPELIPIFELIRDYDVCLQTGHISGEECFPVMEAARKVGVKKIVITHPEYHIVGMRLEQQKQIVRDYGVLLEREYAQPVGNQFVSNLESNVDAIRGIGAEHIILATDSG